MIELSNEDKLKYKLYNLNCYIKLLNLFYFTLLSIKFLLHINMNEFDDDLLININLFIICPLMYFSIKNYCILIVIILYIYKIFFITLNFYNFLYNYTIINIILVLLDIYMYYFLSKYLYVFNKSNKNIIQSLCSNWKPETNLLYFY